ncbi:MAG: RNA polymerase sigma factor [Elusimicrobiota bacterium]
MPSTDRKIPPFENIYLEYRERIFALSYRILGSQQEAEDITQEVFLLAYRKYSSFRHESSVYSWLYKIGMNRCLEKIRSRRRRQRWSSGKLLSIDSSIPGKEGTLMSQQLPDEDLADPLDRISEDQTRDKITFAIESLSEKYRRIIILREIENMSYDEISSILGISIDAIGVQLIRARNKLKKLLKSSDLL